MLLVGLTGGIGTGKSTVSNYLRSIGIPVIDADKIAHQIVEPNTKCWKLIKQKFGDDVINREDNRINRTYLGQQVFSDPEKRRILNRIMHPAIQKQTFMQLLKNFLSFQSVVVLDIPLLFEVSPLRNYLNYIMVVKCDQQQQLQRIKERNGFSDQEALDRILSQMSLEEKCQMADFVIDNSGDINNTLLQTQQIFNNLRYGCSFWVARSILVVCYSAIISIPLLFFIYFRK